MAQLVAVTPSLCSFLAALAELEDWPSEWSRSCCVSENDCGSGLCEDEARLCADPGDSGSSAFTCISFDGISMNGVEVNVGTDAEGWCGLDELVLVRVTDDVDGGGTEPGSLNFSEDERVLEVSMEPPLS